MADELETQDAPSMEDTIRAKLDEINEREAAEDDLPDDPANVEPELPEDAPESPAEKSAGDRSGKRRAGASTKGEKRNADSAQASTANDQPKRPPNSWSPKAKADFAALPPHVQAEVLKREDDFHKGIETYKSDALFAQAIRRIAQPYEATIRAEGGQVEGAFADYLNSAYLLRHGSPAQKAHFVRQLIQQFNVPLSNGPSAGQAQQPHGQQAFSDPVVAQLLNKVGQLEQHLSGQQVSAQRAAEQQTMGSIQRFREDPSRTFFDNVRADMAVLVATERAKTLEEAYDMACWARPDIRPLLLQQQEKARRETAQNKARAARRTAGHNVTQRGALPSQAPRGSIEDTIRAEMQRLGVN